MAYRGTSNFKQEELTSVRRLRESMESPIEKGGGHKPVAKLYRAHGKIHFKFGGKVFAIDGGNVVLDPDMPATEVGVKGMKWGTRGGGPGIAKSAGVMKNYGLKISGQGTDHVKYTGSKIEKGSHIQVKPNGSWMHAGSQDGEMFGSGRTHKSLDKYLSGGYTGTKK